MLHLQEKMDALKKLKAEIERKKRQLQDTDIMVSLIVDQLAHNRDFKDNIIHLSYDDELLSE